MAQYGSQFEQDLVTAILDAEVRWNRFGGSYDYYGMNTARDAAEEFSAEHSGYAGSEDPLEQWLYTSGDNWVGYHTYDPSEISQNLLSNMVVNPMGRSADPETGLYGWGDLAYIYQMTPSGDIARQLQDFRGSGQDLKAFWMETAYGATERQDQGLDTIRQLSAKYGHGQTDVEMNPNLVNQMMMRRTTDRSRRQYKGGSVHAGLLTSPALGFKRQLGG